MRGRTRVVARAGARTALAAVLVLAGTLGFSGCVGPSYTNGPAQQIAGGGPAGVYYGYGEQLAEVLRAELGLDISVTETHGSVDNLFRVAEGQALVGFAQGDTAADAIAGTGDFTGPLPVQAIARVYDEYVQVVVPAGSDIERIADLAGRRVSLGAPNSGVQVIAARVLGSSDVPLEQIDNPELGLDASIEAMQQGRIDGFFWVGGLPTPGIAQLGQTMPIRLLPIEADTVERVNSGHAGVYRIADFPVGAYGVEAPTATMTVPNYLVTAESAPEDLVYDMTRVLFEHRSTIARTVAAAEFLDRRQAIFTAPMDLHAGAVKYYLEARH
ncbi:TAXI family TRAP transporter solute-binding subunit [Leucobacter celer]|jgi:TRAP transporter TAXI family solute receptor|uniref:TAXI family TRAP transporter solute-binding subunit n=1 Tax=Leucobacter celer TaxID=668625 RepID=UPI0006A7BC1E|nr:TAXI family TRAP transporter solute-binding subunit [Leucobacter celer]